MRSFLIVAHCDYEIHSGNVSVAMGAPNGSAQLRFALHDIDGRSLGIH